MLFKNNFYTILDSNKEDGTHTFTIRLNAEHSIFTGHFPGNPVTPGVAQIEIVKELMTESVGKKVHLKKMGNCKFLAILNPDKDQEVEVVLKITAGEDEELKATAMIKNDSMIYLKMNASYFPV